MDGSSRKFRRRGQQCRCQGARRLIVLAAALLAACQAAPPRRADTPQAVAMRQMAADMLAVRSYLNGGIDAAEAARRAADLVALADRTGALFPVDSTPRRYPEISEPMVRAAPAAMRTSTAALLEAIRGGDRLAISRQLTVVEDDGCGACHR